MTEMQVWNANPKIKLFPYSEKMEIDTGDFLLMLETSQESVTDMAIDLICEIFQKYGVSDFSDLLVRYLNSKTLGEFQEEILLQSELFEVEKEKAFRKIVERN